MTSGQKIVSLGMARSQKHRDEFRDSKERRKGEWMGQWRNTKTSSTIATWRSHYWLVRKLFRKEHFRSREYEDANIYCRQYEGRDSVQCNTPIYKSVSQDLDSLLDGLKGLWLASISWTVCRHTKWNDCGALKTEGRGGLERILQLAYHVSDKFTFQEVGKSSSCFNAASILL